MVVFILVVAWSLRRKPLKFDLQNIRCHNSCCKNVWKKNGLLERLGRIYNSVGFIIDLENFFEYINSGITIRDF